MWIQLNFVLVMMHNLTRNIFIIHIKKYLSIIERFNQFKFGLLCLWRPAQESSVVEAWKHLMQGAGTLMMLFENDKIRPCSRLSGFVEFSEFQNQLTS